MVSKDLLGQLSKGPFPFDNSYLSLPAESIMLRISGND